MIRTCLGTDERLSQSTAQRLKSGRRILFQSEPGRLPSRRAKRPKQAVPDAEQFAVVAVRLNPDWRMVDGMDARGDKNPSDDGRRARRQPKPRVRQSLNHKGEGCIDHQVAGLETDQGDYGAERQRARQKFYRVMAYGGGYVEGRVGVVDGM